MLRVIRHLMGDRRRIPFVYHPDYRRELAGIPIDAMRGERILAFLLEERLIRSKQVSLPRPASWENLRRVHSPDYLRTLEDPEVVGQILGISLDERGARGAVELQRLAAGGTIQATRLARRRGGTVMHLGGGFHHAAPERGTGFCLLNDVAVAVARLRARGFGEPILVVDLDIHDGNGTRIAFAGDPSVHTYSLHNETWDEVDAVADTCIALGPGVDDGRYLDTLRNTLPEVVADHAPGLLFYIAGTDVAATDRYGDANLSSEAIHQRDCFVMEVAGVREGGEPIPSVILLGGGYGSTAWRPSARFAGWLVANRLVEPPDDLTAALNRVRWLHRMGEEMNAPERGAKVRDEPIFTFTEEDLAALGGGEGGPPLLLGRYPRSRIVEQLERFGILPQIRARGYLDPRVELLPSTGFGPTVRVFGEPDGKTLLVEVRLDLDHTTLPGMTLLGVEWLLLQDPRHHFPPWRPPLPGQENPGLGVLADTVAWLVTLCEELELDGLGFRSSHFYIAVLARKHLRFLRSGDEARYRAIREATKGRPLAEVTHLVEAGEVRDPQTGEPIRWVDVPMVVPLSSSMRDRLGEPPLR